MKNFLQDNATMLAITALIVIIVSSTLLSLYQNLLAGRVFAGFHLPF